MEYSIVRLSDVPEMEHDAAMWFHEKWNIPLAAYLESMDDCLLRRGAVPQWYLAVAGDRIIGGMGVIENDFHDRRDLAPNVCAVYTEPDCRRRGVAGALLRYVVDDMRSAGIGTLYLLTDLCGFYERFVEYSAASAATVRDRAVCYPPVMSRQPCGEYDIIRLFLRQGENI